MNFPESPAKKLVRLLGAAAPIFDLVFAPLTLLGILWFRIVRYWGVKRLKITRWMFLKLGLFPIVDHYYEPLFDHRKIPDTSKITSHLEYNDGAQLAFLKNLNYGQELLALPHRRSSESLDYYFDNGSFNSGDAELYYSIIRKKKPRKILEIGSGFSTLVALNAIRANAREDQDYRCELICVEPYEMPYLEKLKIRLIRDKIENINPVIFDDLIADDVLFIDSSHMIRPGGDVNYLILKILPSLSSGVWIHFHDIFLPEEYPAEWMRNEFRLWNEQYLLEAFLTGNREYEIVCSLNYLNRKYRREVSAAFPVLGQEAHRQPGSFWIRKK